MDSNSDLRIRSPGFDIPGFCGAAVALQGRGWKPNNKYLVDRVNQTYKHRLGYVSCIFSPFYIQETLNLSTDADSCTDTIFFFQIKI